MANLPLDDIEELAACSQCRRAFDDAERLPKLLDCKHHFCLQCARGSLRAGAGPALRCVHCWQRTDPPEGRADHLPTHTAVLALARHLASAPPPGLAPIPAAPWNDVEDAALREARLLTADLERLAVRRRDYLVRGIDAVAALKLRMEVELAALPPSRPSAVSAAPAERDRLRERHTAALLQSRMDDAVRDAAGPLDFELLRLAIAAPLPPYPTSPHEARDPVLFLANHCTAQLFARRNVLVPTASPAPPSTPSPGAGRALSLPLFYLDVEVNGLPAGRIVIEVRADAAPRMARNFAALATNESGTGYRGCSVFKCWENESVIAGDFEQNDGRGGRSAFAESHFVPDETHLTAVRGAVGMRRSRRRRDRLGLVGSQFRIVLREMRGFSAIFAYVVEGLELVDRLSHAGDGAGKPRDTIVIADCGRLV